MKSPQRIFSNGLAQGGNPPPSPGPLPSGSGSGSAREFFSKTVVVRGSPPAVVVLAICCRGDSGDSRR